VKLFKRVLPTLLLFPLLFLLSCLSIFQEGENRLEDLRVRLLAPKLEASAVYIEIDQESLDFYRKEFDIGWPWPRSLYARAIDYLTFSQARLVVLDMLFTEGSHYTFGEEEDRALAEAIAKNGRVVLPLLFRSAPPVQAPALLRRQALPSLPVQPEERPGILLPLPLLERGRPLLGNAAQFPDRDGLFRSFHHLFLHRGHLYPSLSLRAALSLNPSLPIGKIPWKRDGSLPLFFYRDRNLPTLSISQLIQSQVRREEGAKPVISPGDLKGKIVFIGATAPGLMDLRPTPLQPLEAGYRLNATALFNILRGEFPRSLPAPLFWTLLFLGMAGLSLLLRPQESTLLQLLISSLALLTVSALFFLLFHLFRLTFPLLPAFTGLFLSSLEVIYSRYHAVGKEKKFIQGVFRNYLSDELLKEVLRHPDSLNLGGEKKLLSVFFSDLEGFTTISERLDPQSLVSLLNLYLERMTDIVMDHKGFLDKFEGDAILAFWGAPVPLPDHGAAACRTALACRDALERLNREELAPKGFPPLRMRIGLNTGEIVVGNIGSRKRLEYTVIGDAVNTASRLEGLNKRYTTGILCGDMTRKCAGDEFLFRRIDRVRVKGKSQPEEIHQLLGLKGSPSSLLPEELERFDRGLDLYFLGDFSNALPLFGSLPQDPPSLLFRERCEALLQNPPQEWTGVWTFQEK